MTAPRPLAVLVQNGKQSSSWIQGEDMPAECSEALARAEQHRARLHASTEPIPAGTLAHDMAEAHDAFAALFTTITEALRIPQLVDWLSRTLRRERKNR